MKPKLIFSPSLFLFPLLLLGFLLPASANTLVEKEQESAWEMMQGPTTRFDGNQEELDVFALLKRADVIFVGSIEKIVQSHVPVMQTALPVVVVTFNVAEKYKGDLPEERSYRYSRSLNSITFPKGTKALVSLNRARDGNGYEITLLTAATKSNLSLAKSLKN